MIGWYSAGAFYFARLIFDLITVVIFALIQFVTFEYFEDLGDPIKVLLLAQIIIINFLCSQCLVTIFATIFYRNLPLAVFLALTTSGGMVIYANFYFMIKDTQYFIQILSDFDYYKYTYNSLLILIYGMNRCPIGQQSRVIIEFGLEEDQDLFWKYFTWSFIYYAVLIILSFIMFYMKANRLSFNWFNSFQKQIIGKAVVINDTVCEINQAIDKTLMKNYLDMREDRQILISWFNLTLIIEQGTFFSSKSITLLNNISGCFETNTVNAIMGPSGAGKSTFLKCLNGPDMSHVTQETKIFVQNTNYSKNCFIVQDIYQHLLKGLTVRHTLLYASKLKNSRIVKKLNHNQIVSDLMSELLISDTADNKVESCSGGEQKRVIIASELTAYIKPKILMIDEPTSGLDSNASDVLIECLHRLSRSHNITVITSIHQPNQDLFHMFDTVYVLAKGGVCVYSGLPQNLRQHLNECQIECNENQIPIEVLLKVCSEEKNSENKTKLITKSNESKKQLFDNCVQQKMRSINENQIDFKRFSFKDFYYLLKRTIVYTYIANWKLFLLQFILLQWITFSMTVHYDPAMVGPNGCREFEIGGGCEQTLDQIKDDLLIQQNIKYHLGLFNFTLFTIIVCLCISFSPEFKVTCNENKNGKFYQF